MEKTDYNERRRNIKKEMLKYIEDMDHVSFAELQRHFNDNGGYSIYLKGKENVITWVNMSKEFCDAYIQLEKEKKIYTKSCSPLIYVMDGKMLNLPIPKRRIPKKKCWIPVVLRSYSKFNTESKEIKKIIEGKN